jgi:uncharacterized protein (TIGR02118 family)
VHKVVWFVRFRQDRDRDEIDRRWANEHAALCLKVPGVQRYVQNPVVTTATLEGASDGPPPFDGFAAFWWADRDSYLAAVETPEWQAVLDDSRELFDVEWTLDGMGAEIEERVIREGLGAEGDGVGTPPRGPVKLIGLLQYRKDMSRDEANAYWAGTHTDIAVKIAQIGHYTQNHARSGRARAPTTLRSTGSPSRGTRTSTCTTRRWRPPSGRSSPTTATTSST